MSATLTDVPVPMLGEDVKQIVVDCRHGTTTLTIVAPNPEAMQRQEMAATRLALVKHYEEERCRCTRRLRKRYGVEGARHG